MSERKSGSWRRLWRGSEGGRLEREDDAGGAGLLGVGEEGSWMKNWRIRWSTIFGSGNIFANLSISIRGGKEIGPSQMIFWQFETFRGVECLTIEALV